MNKFKPLYSKQAQSLPYWVLCSVADHKNSTLSSNKLPTFENRSTENCTGDIKFTIWLKNTANTIGSKSDFEILTAYTVCLHFKNNKICTVLFAVVSIFSLWHPQRNEFAWTISSTHVHTIPSTLIYTERQTSLAELLAIKDHTLKLTDVRIFQRWGGGHYN